MEKGNIQLEHIYLRALRQYAAGWQKEKLFYVFRGKCMHLHAFLDVYNRLPGSYKKTGSKKLSSPVPPHHPFEMDGWLNMQRLRKTLIALWPVLAILLFITSIFTNSF